MRLGRIKLRVLGYFFEDPRLPYIPLPSFHLIKLQALYLLIPKIHYLSYCVIFVKDNLIVSFFSLKTLTQNHPPFIHSQHP